MANPHEADHEGRPLGGERHATDLSVHLYLLRPATDEEHEVIVRARPSAEPQCREADVICDHRNRADTVQPTFLWTFTWGLVWVIP